MGDRATDLILLFVGAILRGHGGVNYFGGSYDVVHPCDFTGLYVRDPSNEAGPEVLIEVDPLARPVTAIVSLERKGHTTAVLNTGWGDPNYDTVVAGILAHLWPETSG